jgi:hypothetical protein
MLTNFGIGTLGRVSAPAAAWAIESWPVPKDWAAAGGRFASVGS